MTAQTMEKLILNGDEVNIASNPLETYLVSHKEKKRPISLASDCWLGYYATWEISDERLYLINLSRAEGTIWSEDFGEFNLNYLFPNQKEVFAEWFTGEIRIPQGDMLEYVHGGYESTFESDSFLVFKNGHLVGQRTVDNSLEAAKEIKNKDENILLTKGTSDKNETLFKKILGLLRSKKYR